MSRRRTYRDDELAAAVAASRSWRGVLRALGLNATSSGAIRSVRQHADRLGVDHRHFTGQRRWTDEQLTEAIGRSQSWSEVAAALGLDADRSVKTLKGHAARLSVDVEHLAATPSLKRHPAPALQPDMNHLRRAGSLLAAAWFTLCGHDVSWPLEPSRYDLLVTFDKVAERVQVKSTTVRAGESWIVWLSNSRKTRVTYDPEEIDYFFVIDGDLCYYLIPVAAVGGFHAIHLTAYSQYKVHDRHAATPGKSAGSC